MAFSEAKGKNHFTCIILGAGISGLDAAYHLKTYCPWATYKIFERRANLGGTWDFFKYPGIRSDSDMYTFGFSWKIWKSAKPIAPAEDILAYLKEAAEEQNILENINFNTNVSKAEWKSSENLWHITTSSGEKYTCNVLFGCTGYYQYENPYEPTFQGQEDFVGEIIHPQKWAPKHDEMLINKKVAIIGSGATAVTILPSIADKTEHVTMVQRTPTYIGAKPEIDPISNFFNTWLPVSLATRINRFKAVMLGWILFHYCMLFPNHAKKRVKGMMYAEVKSVMSESEFDKHFTPPYNPWQQRFCLAPGGDFFKPIREGKASIVTGHIDHLTKNGIQMKSGEFVEADMIICSTGLTLQKNMPFSTIEVVIDGKPYKASDHVIYNSVMMSDCPNFGFIVGYTNASWTLKADIASIYFTKLLNYMKENNIAKAVPKIDSNSGLNLHAFNGGLTSGYFARAADVMPKQGDRDPWRGGVNYLVDLFNMWFKGLDLKCMEFTTSGKTVNDKKHL